MGKDKKTNRQIIVQKTHRKLKTKSYSKLMHVKNFKLFSHYENNVDYYRYNLNMVNMVKNNQWPPLHGIRIINTDKQ